MKLNLLILSFISSTLILNATEVPQATKDKYSYLYELSAVENADGSISYHNGRLFKRNGIYVLSLKGDRFEMGFQHGKLLAKEINEGALPQVAKIVENSVKNAFPNIPWVMEQIIAYHYANYSDAILQFAISNSANSSSDVLSEGYGLSEGSVLKLDTVLRGAVGPESLQVILGDRQAKRRFLPLFTGGGGVNQCTDFAAWGKYTKNGNILIGRNTDYPLNGSYDRYPLVIYYEPTDGALKHMAVTSVGLHNAGVVGYNEYGIYLGIHTVPTTQVSTQGFPIFYIGQEVLRQARNFDEAIRIFNKYKPASGWTYTLVSTREKRSASIELTNSQMGIRESILERHAQTNHFLSPNMLKANLDLNVSITEDSIARLQRTEEMLEAIKGKMSVNEAIDILSDKYDVVNKEVRGLANVVAVHTTLSSSVFDPGNEKIFVANGTAPVSLSSYVEFPLVTKFKVETFAKGDFQTIKSKTAQYFPHLAKAEQKFIDAKIAFESEIDPAKANAILKEAVLMDPDNAAYHFTRGIMALKAWQFDDAFTAFEACEKLKYSHYRLLGHYYKARILAHNGDKVQAKALFNQVLTEANSQEEAKLIAAVKDSLKKLPRLLGLPLVPPTLTIFMAEADMIDY